MKKTKRVTLVRITAVLLVAGSLVHCAHKPAMSGRQVTSIPIDNKIDVPSLGLTFVMKDKTAGTPVAAIFDKNGEFYPEIQSKINKKMLSVAQMGMTYVGAELKQESSIYRDSRENYATLVINATTVNGLTKKPEKVKFLVPVERMLITQKGGKTEGLGFWNTTEVRILSPTQTFPF